MGTLTNYCSLEELVRLVIGSSGSGAEQVVSCHESNCHFGFDLVGQFRRQNEGNRNFSNETADLRRTFDTVDLQKPLDAGLLVKVRLFDAHPL